MGQRVPIVKTISPLHNFFFSPLLQYTTLTFKQTNKKLRMYVPSFNYSTAQGHLVKMVRLQNIFLTKRRRTCMHLFVLSPQTLDPL